MESLIQAIRFGGRRARLVLGDAAARSGLTHLPPLPTMIGVILLGLVVPLAFGIPARPAALAEDIAVRRLERYRDALEPRAVHAGPAGEIWSARPCFHWPPHPDAARYSFRLQRDDGATVIQTDLIEEPRYLRRAPASLETGRSYRFEVKALDADGRALAWAGDDGRKLYLQQGARPLRVVEPPEEIAGLVARSRLELPPAEAALVLAGRFATDGAHADVATALETYLDQAADGDHAALARSILERLGCR